jgi:hypothetical protein
MDLRDINKAIGYLRQAKRGVESGSEERNKFNKQMKELKLKRDTLLGRVGVSDKKKELIDKILQIEPELDGIINLYQHSEEDLAKHLDRITSRKPKVWIKNVKVVEEQDL